MLHSRASLALFLSLALLASLSAPAAGRPRLRLLPDDTVAPIEAPGSPPPDPSAASLERWKASQAQALRLPWQYGQNQYSMDGRPEGPRQYWIYVPRSYNHSAPASLIFALHGLGDTALNFASRTNLTALSEDRGFLAVYPQGSRDALGTGWNAGICCVNAAVDDVGFILTILQQAQATFNVRKESVYVFGFSNGGFMSERLGCEQSAHFRALASVAGNTVLVAGGAASMTACDRAYAGQPRTEVLHLHGTADPVVPWAGSELLGWASIPEDLDAWARRNACPGVSRQTWSDWPFSNQLWDGCGGDDRGTVELVVVEHGDHHYEMDNDPRGFRSTNYILDFFGRVTPGGI